MYTDEHVKLHGNHPSAIYTEQGFNSWLGQSGLFHTLLGTFGTIATFGA